MDGVVAKIGEHITRISVLGKTGPEILFIKRLRMRMGVGLVQCFSGLYLRNLNKRGIVSMNDNVLVIKTKMMLGRFEIEELRQKIIKDAEEGVVIIPGFFDVEIILKPDDVVIDCFKNEEDNNGNC